MSKSTGKPSREDCVRQYSMKHGRKGHSAGTCGCVEMANDGDDWEIVDDPVAEDWTQVARTPDSEF